MFELSCMYGHLFNNNVFLTIELVRSDVNIMVYQTDHIKVSYVVWDLTMKTKIYISVTLKEKKKVDVWG